ncbi:MAG: FkbM family methyltransferase [Thermoleophilaceae bacterium]|nr:FkbM family methyltransferase [Thermoleophilaceae bacterium]
MGAIGTARPAEAPRGALRARAREALRVGRAGPVSRRLARTLVRAAPVRGVDVLAFIVIGRPRGRRQLVQVERDGVRYGLDLSHDVHRLIYLGLYEREAADHVATLIRPGDLVVDVGANCGFWTLAAVRQGADVVAIEPVPSNLELLRRNLALNGEERRVRVVEAAAGEGGGRIEIRIPATADGSEQASIHHSAGDDARPVEVELVSIDSVVAGEEQPVRLMKMDVEGNELAALRGAERAIAGGRVQHLILEMMDENLARAGTSAREVADWLVSHGFRPERWFDQKGFGLRPLPAPRSLPLPPPPGMDGLVHWRHESAE